MSRTRTTWNEAGQTLLLLLVVTVMLLPLGAGFLRSMMLQQRFVGDRYRATAALYLAEAGIEKTLWLMEHGATNGTPDASWASGEYTEEFQVGDRRGRFRVTVQEEGEGRIAIVSTGDLGGVRRGVKVIAKVASGALDYAVFGAGLIAIDGDQAVLALTEVRDHCRKGIMLASNTEIWFRAPGSRLEFVPCGQNEPVLQIGLPDPRQLTVGDAHGTARYMGLQPFGIRAGRLDMQTISAEAPPAIDAAALRRRALKNEANAVLNQAAGHAADRPDLRDKRHSLYTPDEFALIMRYLRGRTGFLVGGIYVTGSVLIPGNVPLTISGGFLAVEGSMAIEARGRLTIRHSRDARLLPAVVTIGQDGSLVVGEEARVELEGAVVSQGPIDLREGSSLQVHGAILALAPRLSLRVNNASLLVRYDPMVPGTVGILAAGGRRVVVPLSWQELR